MATKKISDAGMILPGAPKDRAKNILKEFNAEYLIGNIYDSIGKEATAHSLLDVTSLDSRSLSLLEDWQKSLTKAKVWPSPPFVDLLESGVPYPIVRGLRNLYDQFPAAPIVPSPEELSAITELFLSGKAFEEALNEIWKPWVEHCANQPPSYLRIMQQWTSLYSTYVADYRKREELISKAESLFGKLDTESSGILYRCCKKTDKASGIFLTEANDKFKAYSLFYNGISLPVKQYKRYAKISKNRYALEGIIGDDKGLGEREFTAQQIDICASSYTNMMRYIPSSLMDGRPVDQSDRHLGEYFSHCFKELKNKPRKLTLEDKTSKKEKTLTESSKKDSKLPTRPVRLNEEETQKLLNDVDSSELKNNPFYQSFDPLVEAGMIRGAQIGNWVTHKERPALVRKNYDALIALSKTLRITPSLVGLGNPIRPEDTFSDENGLIKDVYDGNQALGLAFGARGKSSAAAHFEPALNVINLTRKNGAGSTAHEWAHAFDYRLGGFLDLQKVNKKYHPTDLKRVTLSDSIRYFSEFSAMYWFFQTYKQSSFTTKESQERQHRTIIENALREDLELNDGERKSLVDLMVGVSHLIKDMYHVENTPEKLKEKFLASAASQFNSHTQHGDVFLNKIHSFLEEMSFNNESLRSELLKWKKGLVSFCDDPACNPYSINDCHENNIVGHRVSIMVVDEIIDNLQRETRRDFSTEAKQRLHSTLKDYLDSSILIFAIERAAERSIRDLMLPPHPDEHENDIRVQTCWKAGISHVLNSAPLDFLKELSNLNSRHKNEGIFNSPLKPTQMGMANGDKELVLNSRDNPSFSLVDRIFRTLGKILDFSTDLTTYYQYQLQQNGLSKGIENKITQWDPDVGFGISQVHEGLFKVPLLLDIIKEDYGYTPLRKDLKSAYSIYDEETQQKETITEFANLSQTELFTQLMSETDSLPFQRCPMEDSRFLSMALLDTHLKSKFNDGTWASVAQSFIDPQRLTPFPAGLVTYLEDFEERRAPAPSRAPSNSTEWDDLIQKIPDRVITTSTGETIAAAVFIKDMPGVSASKKQLGHAHAEFMAAVFLNALQTRDTSGLENYDEAVRQRKLRSFKYQENRANIAMLSSFMPQKHRDFCFDKMSEKNLASHLKGTQSGIYSVESDLSSQSENFGQDDISCRARIAIALQSYNGLYNYSIERQTRRIKETATQSLISDLRNESHELSAGRQFGHKVFRFEVSPFVRNSAEYDNGNIGRRGHCKVGKRRYWSQSIELFARLTEKVIFERLNQAGTPDPFLVTTPSKALQNRIIKKVSSPESGDYSESGKHYELCYPAAADLERMMDTFEQKVVPALQPALNALYPHSVPHYERYIQRINDKASNKHKVLNLHSNESTCNNEIDDQQVSSIDGKIEHATKTNPLKIPEHRYSHDEFSLFSPSGPAR